MARSPCSAARGHDGVAAAFTRRCRTARTEPNKTTTPRMTKAATNMTGQCIAHGSGSCWTICRRTRLARSTKLSPACEARRVLRRLEFHYVPKHASWLNMVEIEIGVLRGQCLDRRIATPQKLVSEIAAWERQRNTTGARINWMFTTEKARYKMGRAYPTTVAVPVQ